MTTLITYTRVVTPITTHTLRLPDAPMGQQAGQELATLPDGRTVVALFDGYTLPATQPTAIQDSIEALPSPLPDDLREVIKAASPHVALIAKRMVDTIRAKYSVDDEMYFARIGVGAATGMYTPSASELQEMADFGQFCEGVRQWGRAERAKLGL